MIDRGKAEGKVEVKLKANREYIGALDRAAVSF